MSHADTHAAPHAHASEESHACPFWILASVFGALLVFTVITVAATLVDLGPLNIVVAMVIALIKAALVAAFFMHLYWDSPFNAVALISGVCFAGLLIGLSIIDGNQYAHDKQDILKSDAGKAIHAPAKPAETAAPAPAAAAPAAATPAPAPEHK